MWHLFISCNKICIYAGTYPSSATNVCFWRKIEFSNINLALQALQRVHDRALVRVQGAKPLKNVILFTSSVYLPNSVHFTFLLFLSKCLLYGSQSYISERSWVSVCYFIGSLLVNTKIVVAKSQTSHASFSPKSRSHTRLKEISC